MSDVDENWAEKQKEYLELREAAEDLLKKLAAAYWIKTDAKLVAVPTLCLTYHHIIEGYKEPCG